MGQAENPDTVGTTAPWWTSAVDPSMVSIPRADEPSEPPRTPAAMLPRGWSSPHPPTPPSSSSPRARRPPTNKVSTASEARAPLQNMSPGAAFYTNLPKSFIRSPRSGSANPGVTAPRCNGKVRSRSLPTPPGVAEDVDTVATMSFFEAFGGFYRQLVQGPQCTGPYVLATDERSHEVDLSN